jgi:hypothetical protein
MNKLVWWRGIGWVMAVPSKAAIAKSRSDAIVAGREAVALSQFKELMKKNVGKLRFEGPGA